MRSGKKEVNTQETKKDNRLEKIQAVVFFLHHEISVIIIGVP